MIGILSKTIIRMLRISRPYTTPYAALCCLCGLLSGGQAASSIQIAVAMLLAPTLSISMPALNDYAHRHKDAQAGRERNYPPQLLLAMGIAGLIAGIAIAIIGGTGVVIALLASVVVGLGYAAAKRLPPGSANLVRGLYTVTLATGCATMTGLTRDTLLIALIIYFADSGGNVWGDIRDVDVDVLAGIRTIAVANLRHAVMLARTLLTISLIPLTIVLTIHTSIITGLGVAAFLLVSGIILLGVYRDHLYRHRWIIHLKVVALSSAGLALARTSFDQVAVAATFVAAMITLNTFYPWLHKK